MLAALMLQMYVIKSLGLWKLRESRTAPAPIFNSIVCERCRKWRSWHEYRGCKVRNKASRGLPWEIENLGAYLLVTFLHLSCLRHYFTVHTFSSPYIYYTLAKAPTVCYTHSYSLNRDVEDPVVSTFKWCFIHPVNTNASVYMLALIFLDSTKPCPQKRN